MLWGFVALLIVALNRDVCGYGTGAPAMTCGDMMPQHGGNRPLTTAVPYTLSLSKQTYRPGETIIVSLQGVQQTTFRGYLIQARPVGRAALVGAFSIPQGSQTVTCGFGGSEGVTHTERSDKQRVTLHWTAPTSSVGSVVILATVVHSYNNFWLGVSSPVLNPETATQAPVAARTPAPVAPTRFPFRPDTTLAPTQQTTQRTNIVTLRPQWTKRPLPIPITNNPRIAPAVDPRGDTDVDFNPPSQGATGINLLRTDPNCGKTKGCYMKCRNHQCKFIVTWQSKGNDIHFEMASVVPPQRDNWIAIGFSGDTKMGGDSVVECVAESGLVQVFNSYNEGFSNKRLQNPKVGITGESGSVRDGIMRCQFNRAMVVPSVPQLSNLNQDWHLMFADGAARPGFQKAMHGTTKDTMPVASSLKIDFQNFQVVDKAASYPLVKVHACFMLLAWVFFTGVGIITARYYKSVWEYSTLLGLRIWFQIHRACMVAAFALTIIGFIIIFVEAGGYSQVCIGGHGYLKAHPVLGIIVTILVIINPIMSLFRPPPATTRRPIFNWSHWAVGMLAHLLAVLTICFGIQLGKSSTPNSAVYVMVGCVLYQVLLGVTLEVLKFIEKRKLEKAKMETLEMKSSSGSSGSLSNGTSRKASTAMILIESPIRKILLLVHVVVMFAFTLALILLVAMN
ncbi:hypothetical protein ScPMuIL_005644 [Solemya velum]